MCPPRDVDAALGRCTAARAAGSAAEVMAQHAAALIEALAVTGLVLPAEARKPLLGLRDALRWFQREQRASANDDCAECA